jgi:hypothetical protein
VTQSSSSSLSSSSSPAFIGEAREKTGDGGQLGMKMKIRMMMRRVLAL